MSSLQDSYFTLPLEYDEVLLSDNLGIHIPGVGCIGQYNSYYHEMHKYGIDGFIKDNYRDSVMRT